MTTPIDTFMANVEWAEAPDKDKPTAADGIPHVTHSGVLDFVGYKFRCYRLSDGTRIFDADDLNAAFFGDES